MAKKRKKRSNKAGLPPGTMVYIGDQKLEHIKISLFHYSQNGCEECHNITVDECVPYLKRSQADTSVDAPVTWINIDGLHEISVIEKIGQIVGLHPLVLEDLVNTTQRPKRVDYDDYIFVCLRAINYQAPQCIIDTEQMSFILGRNYVISFQEEVGDCFNPIRERIRHGKGRARKLGADYLFYALLDLIVDNYFLTLENLGDQLEQLEDVVLESSSDKILLEIHRFRREMLVLRRAVWPLRDIISGLSREQLDLISENTQVFLRDVYDHAIEIIEIVEALRDMSASMVELYMSNMTNKVNVVMKTLTLIATIFMPLTFIVGVYGMNFDFMPELHWKYGYHTVWLIMLLITIGMLVHFRRRNWI